MVMPVFTLNFGCRNLCAQSLCSKCRCQLCVQFHVQVLDLCQLCAQALCSTCRCQLCAQALCFTCRCQLSKCLDCSCSWSGLLFLLDQTNLSGLLSTRFLSSGDPVDAASASFISWIVVVVSPLLTRQGFLRLP